jgi:LacI family transcriptional regulator
MAANDVRARQVLESCRSVDLRVPEDVAVIGVDNDELFCLLSNPPLSSVEHGAKQLGYEAAALLDEMMAGKKRPTGQFLIEPVGVVARQTTNVVAAEDPEVQAAMTFISNHAREGINVQQVLQAVGVSRSGLEKRFKTALGYTVYRAIRKVQLEETRRMVFETPLPLKQVAATTGFRSVQHMTTIFGKAFGHPPGAYRRRRRPPV